MLTKPTIFPSRYCRRLGMVKSLLQCLKTVSQSVTQARALEGLFSGFPGLKFTPSTCPPPFRVPPSATLKQVHVLLLFVLVCSWYAIYIKKRLIFFFFYFVDDTTENALLSSAFLTAVTSPPNRRSRNTVTPCRHDA